MTILESLKKELSMYQKLKYTTQEIIEKIKLGIDSLELVDSKLLSYYSVDNMMIDNNMVEKTKRKLIDKEYYLSVNVINEINSEIRSLKRRIDEEEARSSMIIPRNFMFFE